MEIRSIEELSNINWVYVNAAEQTWDHKHNINGIY